MIVTPSLFPVQGRSQGHGQRHFLWKLQMIPLNQMLVLMKDTRDYQKVRRLMR